MSFFTWNNVTKLLVGKEAATRSEYKQLDRKYKDAERANKLYTEVPKPESFEDTNASRPKSVRFAPTEDSQNVAEENAQRPFHPMPQRTFSVSSAPHVSPKEATTNNENVSLITSHSSNCISPIGRVKDFDNMTGFGKYRRARNASKEWQLEFLERSLSNDGDVVMGYLGDHPPQGIDEDVWTLFKNKQFRCVRSSSVHTMFKNAMPKATTPTNTPTMTPTTGASTEYTDALTGTRVIRGFAMPTMSSAPASCRRNKSMTLEPIKEGEKLVTGFGKMERACTFNDDDNDDCALATDDEE